MDDKGDDDDDMMMMALRGTCFLMSGSVLKILELERLLQHLAFTDSLTVFLIPGCLLSFQSNLIVHVSSFLIVCS